MTRTKNDLRRNVVDLDQAARPESRRLLRPATGALSISSAKALVKSRELDRPCGDRHLGSSHPGASHGCHDLTARLTRSLTSPIWSCTSQRVRSPLDTTARTLPLSTIGKCRNRRSVINCIASATVVVGPIQ